MTKFFQHMCSQLLEHWNNLPSSVVEAPSMKAFDMRLDKYWKEHELVYNYREEINYSPIAIPSVKHEDDQRLGTVEEMKI